MDSLLRILLLVLVPCGLAFSTIASAASSTRPTVVELYTSQGCSSCPPADALLGELTRRPNVLGLAFHVRYWDSLGWKDRFGLALADERQSRYVRALNLSSAFTPQIVIDGQRSFVGSDRSSILPAVSGTRDGIPIAIEREVEGLTIELGAGATPGSADVLLLALTAEAQTAVGHGENGGRTLREFNIVRAGMVLGSWSGSAQRYTVARSALPSDATSVAVLLQLSGERSILGAASIELR